MLTAGWDWARWLTVFLLGAGLALAGWLSFGSPRADAQAPLDLFEESDCDGPDGRFLPAVFFGLTDDAKRAEVVADCKVMVAIRNQFLFGPNGEELNRSSVVAQWASDATGARVDIWFGVDFGEGHRVESLRLVHQQLTGTIPTQIGDLTGLQTLNLSANRLSGEIPNAIVQIETLQELRLLDNQLTGDLPDLSALVNLQQLRISDNLLATIHSSLSTLTQLTWIDLSRNRLTGDIPDLSDLTNLETLYLFNNQLTGEIPDLRTLVNLQLLYLQNNLLEGEITFPLGELTSLTHLYLYNNQLTGMIPDFSGLTDLVDARMEDNRLTGPIPMLSNLPALTILQLQNNQLTGRIPTTLGSLSALEFLNLSYNQLDGPIPTNLGNLESLAWLQLQNNRLEGEIPPQLGGRTATDGLKPLAILRLNNNRLEGEIPAELGDLGNLQQLRLHSNRLEGVVPAELDQLSMLTQLTLCNNRFVGVADSLRQFLMGLGSNLCIGSAPMVQTSGGDGRVFLSWVFGEPGVERFEYRFRVSGGEFPVDDDDMAVWEEVGGRADSVVVAGLMNGQEYDFQVRARFGGGGVSSAGLVSAVPMGVAGTVRGGDGAEGLARFSACAGVDVGASRFADIGGSFARDNIACIYQFGITKGRSATRFSTLEMVPRWQMALFLARAAVPAGVVLADPVPVPGFTDISGLSVEARRAANALAAAGIMPGISDTVFAPNRLVSRASMARLLDEFLARAVIGTGGTDPDDVRRSDTGFTDIDNVPVATFDAIGRIYELGITRGTTATTFDPTGTVTREQMSAFITRMLDHTQARLPGVTLQAPVGADPVIGDSLEILASVRDNNFQPVVDASVDLFSYTNADAALDQTGGCTSRVTTVEGSTACQIDFGDPLTDLLGDAEIILPLVPTQVTTIVAWTGTDRDIYDADTTDDASLVLAGRNPADRIVVSDNLAATQQKLRFGETFTLTLQITDQDGTPLARPGGNINIHTVETSSTGATTTATRTYTTDSTGQVRFTYTQTDPNQDDSPDATVQISLRAANYRLQYQTTPGLCENNVCTATWSDNPRQATTLQLTQTRPYTIANDRASNRVVATLTDQYGTPIRGEQITITPGSTNPLTRTTNRRGQTTYTYPRNLATSLRETITATHTPQTEEGSVALPLPADGLTHLWITELAAGTNISEKSIQLADTTNNRIIIRTSDDPNDLRFVNYDPNDQYNNGDTATSLANFEQGLPNATHITITHYTQNPNQVTALTLN